MKKREGMAKLHFKYGAMNSGKSDTLIKTAYNYGEQGLRVAVIKPGVDVKGGDKIVARAGGEWAVDILALPTDDIRVKVIDMMNSNPTSKLNCILTDESQFFTSDQVDQLYELAKVKNISIIAFGLKSDFKRNLFPGSKRLIELADNIEKLPTMCRCASQAEFNTRQINGNYVFDGEQVAIDGEQNVTYDSLCGPCYLDEKEKANTKSQMETKS